MAYQTHWDSHSVFQRYWGEPTPSEFLMASEELHADPRFDALHFIVNDFSKASGHLLSRHAISEVVAMRIGGYRSNPNIRIAIIGADQHFRLLAELSQETRLDAYPVRCFESLGPVLNQANSGMPYASEWK